MNKLLWREDMKTISYVALTAWICIAGTLYGTMWVMNKIRIEDSTVAAAENINRLIEIDQQLKQGDITGARDSIGYFLDRQLRVAQSCDYKQCISPVKERVQESVNSAENYQRIRNAP